MTLLLMFPETGEQTEPPPASAARLRTLTGVGTCFALFLVPVLAVLV